jgi:predicted Zn finger-like uncharacterized protein
MLVTTCKHCTARFRVTPDQLNLKQGQVRCGECGGVFNGFESLERFPGDDTGTRLLAARATPPVREQPEQQPALPPVEVTDRAPARAEGASGASAAESLSAQGPAPARAHWAVVPESEPQATVPDRQPEPMPDLDPPVESPPPSPRRTEETQRPLSDFTMPVPEPTPPPRPSRAWSFAAVLLALVMGMQLAYAFRAEIAARYPPARPVLESVCALARCTVPWINQDSALKLEDSELLEVPGKPGQIALTARIRSLAALPMEYPHVELTLTDTTGQVAVRRVLKPSDYLGRAPAAGDVLSAGTDLLVSLRLDTGRVKATGYELMLFYP